MDHCVTMISACRIYSTQPAANPIRSLTCAHRPGTWFGKPARLSATVCASHGWTNSSMDTLECPSCGAVVAFTSSDTLLGHDADEAVDAFLRDLAQRHTSYCIWHGHPPTSHDLIAFPTAQAYPVCEALVGRIAELAQLEALPYLGGSGMAVLTDRCLNQLLAYLDTAVVPIMVRCHAANALWTRGSVVGQVRCGWKLLEVAGMMTSSDSLCQTSDALCVSHVGLSELPDASSLLGEHCAQRFGRHLVP
jgi:hypothetical protein